MQTAYRRPGAFAALRHYSTIDRFFGKGVSLVSGGIRTGRACRGAEEPLRLLVLQNTGAAIVTSARDQAFSSSAFTAPASFFWAASAC